VETEAGRRLLRGLPSQGTGLVALNVEALSEAISAIEAEAAEKAPDSLDAAWAEAEAALPEGWWLHALDAWSFDDMAWRVEAASAGHQEPSDSWARYHAVRGPSVATYGPTPAAALRALAAKLRSLPVMDSGEAGR
jgi:hypothetical protein